MLFFFQRFMHEKRKETFLFLGVRGCGGGGGGVNTMRHAQTVLQCCKKRISKRLPPKMSIQFHTFSFLFRILLDIVHTFAVEPLYNGHLEGRRKWPLWRGFEQESIYKFLAAGTKKSGRCRELVHLTWYFKLSSIAQVRTKARYLCSRWGIDKNKQDWKLLLSSAAEISFRNWTMTFSRNCPLLTIKWWEKGIPLLCKIPDLLIGTLSTGIPSI